jgi:uncharacterized protein (DUF433 family)
MGWLSCGLSMYEQAMADLSRITLEHGKRGGRPCVRGLRITVYDVLGWMASGMSESDILRDYPELEHEDLLACLQYAANREKLLAIGAA